MQISKAETEAITSNLITRPCPFCGSRALLKSHRDPERPSRRFTVECSNPSCPVEAEARGSDMDEALAKWATREQQDPPPVSHEVADIREWPRAGMVACDFCLNREAELVMWSGPRPSDASRVLDRGLAICGDCVQRLGEAGKETPCTKPPLA